MKVTQLRCEACGAADVEDLLVQSAGETPAVLVRCAACGELVARLTLAGYYHHGEGFAPTLAGLRVPTESALDVADEVGSARERALDELAQAVAILEAAEAKRE